ncbi:MAG: phosphoheptose isomerase [Elusimicrobia bacterium CG08_land_8_20_14_0_20_51_18]|nr:MAG: phosphoheptose isomerase [Elusimicrobia bacterium CG08_land_8_20_14_0_20_51_18]
MKTEILKAVEGLSRALPAFASQAETVEKIALELLNALKNGHKILVCGNGGSAAESQHMAAEIVGRFRRNRRALPALALTTDTSVITSVANDYSFEEIFSRQVEALGEEGDVLVAFSTSGGSRNVLKAAEAAARKKMKVVGVTGPGGELADKCSLALKVADPATPRIQEIHLLFVHIVCELLEKELA